jgi:ADP-ribose pyrophosphatase YjhB (NUDIX family)
MQLLKSDFVKTLVVQTWGRFPFPRPVRRLIQWVLSPKFIVGVVAVVFDEQGRLLLLRHTYKRKYPWGPPGGGMDYGETTEQTALRELREEAGVDAAIVRLLGVRTDRARRLIDVFYLCRPRRQAFQPNPEISDYGYFALDALPDGVSPLLREMIEHFVADGLIAAESIRATDEGI